MCVCVCVCHIESATRPTGVPPDNTVCVCVCACVCACVFVCEKRANREPAFSHATAYVVVCELYVCPRATAHLSVRVVPRIEVHDSEDEEGTGSRF